MRAPRPERLPRIRPTDANLAGYFFRKDCICEGYLSLPRNTAPAPTNMEMTLEYGLMVLLALVVVYAMYYYFVKGKKKKCTTSADCPNSDPCISGYCGKTVSPSS